MSQKLLTIPATPYIGQPFKSPMNLGEKSNMAPTSVGALINWIAYGAATTKPEVGVEINLVSPTQGNNKLLDKIVSVYIDNTQSDVPIYVFFPDTQCTVTAPPNSCATFPVITNDTRAIVYGRGFTTGKIPITQLYFTNVFIPPAIDYEVNNAIAFWLASPEINRGLTIYNSTYGVPALGDQTANYNIPFYTLAPTVILGSPKASGFFYIQNMSLKVVHTNDNVNSRREIYIESTGPTGLLWTFRYVVPSGPIFNQNLYSGSAMNVKIRANEEWRIRINATTGTAINNFGGELMLNYTYQPD